jgi:amino acid transporter
MRWCRQRRIHSTVPHPAIPAVSPGTAHEGIPALTTDLPSGPSTTGGPATTATETALPGDHHVSAGLRAGAVGLIGVLFMAVANAAPITAMTGNVPIAVGFGNGVGAPAGFVFATIVLTLFTVGYVAMARHVTTTGAFYGFISHGLGQITGMAAGLVATVAYVIFEGSLIGGFAYFGNDAIKTFTGADVHWMVLASIGTVVIAALTYYDISLTAAVLSVTLVSEVLLLSALALSVIFKGGGPDGLLFNDAVPLVPAFKALPAHAYGTTAAAGAAAVGIFFAFWSWVGYETTAVYGEESKNPKKIVPQATLIAVVGLGIFYTLISWLVIAGNGRQKSVDLATGANPLDLFFGLVKANLGSFPLDLYKTLLVIGSFACAMAFHNAASRYIFALGREMPWAAVRNSVGATNAKHHSPGVASLIQSGVTLAIIVLFYLFTNVQVPNSSGGTDATPSLVPYVNIYGMLALIGTAMILIVQTVCSIAVIFYFNVRKVHRGGVLSTLISPLIGGVGMVYALSLLWQSRAVALGYASDSLVFTTSPYWVGAIVVVGIGYALWLRGRHPDTYAEIGRTTLQEAHERL